VLVELEVLDELDEVSELEDELVEESDCDEALDGEDADETLDNDDPVELVFVTLEGLLELLLASSMEDMNQCRLLGARRNAPIGSAPMAPISPSVKARL
jgi:hypothetical protein